VNCWSLHRLCLQLQACLTSWTQPGCISIFN